MRRTGRLLVVDDVMRQLAPRRQICARGEEVSDPEIDSADGVSGQRLPAQPAAETEVYPNPATIASRIHGWCFPRCIGSPTWAAPL